eukprot:gnl/TRDRNA2_/TRDRNA2_102049_c1_seq1.p1 gnl/TRDRNA2_/TRDRNA2_102049_c1~~gnl/TRDRNA2_/TRDRNA2_102049_c1_seq1.p1  ORF type:complete len:281 (+),score=46.23 gnl/TRDRNA2_/TRDRNA2_102049_c1_seq1:103-843(+)
MLDDGFEPQIRGITGSAAAAGKVRQGMLFSATFADHVSILASWILRNAVEIRVGCGDALKANPDIDQRVTFCKSDGDKEGCVVATLRKVFAKGNADPGKVIIFCAEKTTCDELSSILWKKLHARTATLHGGLKQAEREAALERFRHGDPPILIATSVAGRGLDVKDIRLVVNYDAPHDPEDYVHRIGRTGRAGQKGVALALLSVVKDGAAMAYIAQVMRRTGLQVPADLVQNLKMRRGREASLPTF